MDDALTRKGTQLTCACFSKNPQTNQHEPVLNLVIERKNALIYVYYLNLGIL